MMTLSYTQKESEGLIAFLIESEFSQILGTQHTCPCMFPSLLCIGMYFTTGLLLFKINLRLLTVHLSCIDPLHLKADKKITKQRHH